MVEIDPKTLNTLADAFALFRQDPLFQLQVKIRRHRAAELRTLLANPEAIDLEMFNREVWQLESYTSCNGQDITGRIYSASLSDTQSISPEEIATFDAAIDEDRFSFHGNAIWGSGTRIYGAPLKHAEEVKLENVRQALRILNDVSLTPSERTELIDEIPGFGYNIASGLVMVYHPEEFGLYNAPPRRVLDEIQLPNSTLEKFQESLDSLRRALGADDYLELDWFLYLIHAGMLDVKMQPRFWWVNQGGTYKYERDAGYIWAPATSRIGRSVSHHQAVRNLHPGDVIFHYSQGAVLAVSQVRSTYVDATRPSQASELRWETEGYLVETDYSDLDQPIPLQDIPLSWRAVDNGPFTRNGTVKQGYLFPVTYQFAERLGAIRADDMPDYVPRGTIEQRVWMFQANPAQFDLEARLAEVNDDPTSESNLEEWKVTRYRAQMQVGDTALIWQSGPYAGIYAVAEISDTFFDRPVAGGTENQVEHSAELRFTSVLPRPITRDSLREHPVLKDLQILRISQGTNFPVTSEQWNALQPLLTRHQNEIPTYEPPAFDQIRTAIAEEGLRITDDRLRQYHLALTTSRFVILAGNSGTGKSWLAQAYAQAVAAEAQVVPVAPNWNTNEDLLGYFNPFDNTYHDTQFSTFLRRAASEFEHAANVGVRARPFHLILDEMNLARVEYYFARFLSAMELTSRDERGFIELSPDERLILPGNLYFVGTVNIDETTHAFADKIYDRAQLIELDAPRDLIVEHLGDADYTPALLEIWDAVQQSAPFNFRVINQMRDYIREAEELEVPWETALDEQVLHKVLPKINGTEPHVGETLRNLMELTRARFPLSYTKVQGMHERFSQHGFTSYF